MKFKLLLLLVSVTGYINIALAQTHANEFGFQSDNDSFLAQGSDRYYTNGLFIFYRHGMHVNRTDSLGIQNKVLGFEFGQKIFNPFSGQVPYKNLIDRPFAGYLYAGANLNLLYGNESNLKLGVQAGVVGPSALGKEAQQVIHNTFGFYTLEGWQYQIKDAAQLNLSAEYNRLLGRTKGADISLNTNANLGTGFTGAGAGVTVRLGAFNQLFNSVSTQSSAIQGQAYAPLSKHEFFFYYKPSVNFVAYDATIQGGLSQKHNEPGSNEVTLTKKPMIISNELGASYGGSRWIFNFGVIFHSRETREMPKAHQWGSATILYRFN